MRLRMYLKLIKNNIKMKIVVKNKPPKKIQIDSVQKILYHR